jgi:hypothetical protein
MLAPFSSVLGKKGSQAMSHIAMVLCVSTGLVTTVQTKIPSTGKSKDTDLSDYDPCLLPNLFLRRPMTDTRFTHDQTWSKGSGNLARAAQAQSVLTAEQNDWIRLGLKTRARDFPKP